VPLRVGEDAERHAGDLLRRLDDRPAELLRPRERRLDVLDPMKKSTASLPPWSGPIAVGIPPSAPVFAKV